MKTAIRKMGNSQGVIIPKPLLAEIGLKANDAVELKVSKRKIVIEPVHSDPRAGWAEASKAIHAAGDDKLVWCEFAHNADKDWRIER